MDLPVSVSKEFNVIFNNRSFIEYLHSLLVSHQKELTMSHKNLVAVNDFL